MKASSASVLICTFNRAALLETTLVELCSLTVPPDCSAEIVIVDNNSTDATPDIVARAQQSSPIPIKSVRETRQGKSFALNRGLEVATGDIIALTDDDVWPAKDWLARIVANFRQRELTFVFGKVLPRWSVPPPPELLIPRAQDVWGPLAIVDYGDTPSAYTPGRTGQRLPIGANLAFRRSTIEAIGGWRTDLGKVNNTLISGEDHEIFTRLRRAGRYAGYYDPKLEVRHFVPADRLTRKYFRRWFFWHGKTQALMLGDLFLDLNLERAPHVLGVPRFIYRQAIEQLGRWIRRFGDPDSLSLMIEELKAIQFTGLLVQCWYQYFRGARTWRSVRA
jgi:glycosyltransferase involved in cell wall biosynthesis